jgi:hypothetical protein
MRKPHEGISIHAALLIIGGVWQNSPCFNLPFSEQRWIVAAPSLTQRFFEIDHFLIRSLVN